MLHQLDSPIPRKHARILPCGDGGMRTNKLWRVLPHQFPQANIPPYVHLSEQAHITDFTKQEHKLPEQQVRALYYSINTDKQQDALSFFRSLVKTLSEEEKSTTNTKKTQELFQGEDKRRLICPQCNHIQVLYQSFSDVGIVN